MKISDYSGQGDYLFAQNLSGIEFRLLSDELIEAEDLEHDVEGKWIEVQTPDFEEGHLAAVGELIGELQRLNAQPGDLFEVTRCKKSGPKQTDTYEVNLEAVEPEQSRL